MNKLINELSKLDLNKIPTRYLLSLLRRTQKEQYLQWDDWYDCYIDKKLYDKLDEWEIKIRNVLKTKEHIVTSKIERKKIRQLAAKRKS